MSAVLLSAAVGSAAIGFWSNSELSHSISESALLARVLRNQGDADMMHDAVRGDVYRALHAARELPSQRAEVEEQLAKHLAWFQRVMAENKALSLPGHLRNQFSQLDGPLAAYMEAAAQLTALAFTDPVNADRLLPGFVEKFGLLEDAMERVSSAIEAEAGRVEREAGDLARMAGWVIGLASLLNLGFLALVFRRSLQLMRELTTRMYSERALADAKMKAEKAQHEAERASAAKTEFLASMSHEIRTPLNGILGYTDLLLDDASLGPDQQRQLERIRESGSALLTVVNDVLDFSKIEAGQVDLTPHAFTLGTLIDNAAAIVSAIADKKRLPLRVEIAPDLPKYVLGDQDRLRQVLLNLLNNAVKFTLSGEVVLRVACLRTAPDMCTLRFSVTDTGIGIPREKQDRLFHRFSQVDGSISREFGGTGLGLAISKRLVELMDGEIGVESTEGRGSTFWFSVSLPVAEKSEGRAVIDVGRASSQRRRILLVEDNQINQEIACAVLTAGGHEVDVAADGAEAILAAQAKAYDLVLMDVQMPGMDGITATRHIRALQHPARDLPIIAMTANLLPQQIDQFLDAGMDDYVGKPFKRPELLSAIDRWSRRRRRDRPLDANAA